MAGPGEAERKALEKAAAAANGAGLPEGGEYYVGIEAGVPAS